MLPQGVQPRAVSTSAFAPKLPPSPGYGETSRRDKQVIDISSKMARSRVVSSLISRRLRRKPRVFGAFLTCKGVDFSPLTQISPKFCFPEGWGEGGKLTIGRGRGA
jgi:hypothetical protein